MTYKKKQEVLFSRLVSKIRAEIPSKGDKINMGLSFPDSPMPRPSIVCFAQLHQLKKRGFSLCVFFLGVIQI